MFAIVGLYLFANTLFAADYFITKADLNIRSGAGSQYKSIGIITKGDTVKSIGESDKYWIKIAYQSSIGYSAKKFLEPVKIKETDLSKVHQESSDSTSKWGLIIAAILILVLLIKGKKSSRHQPKTSTDSTHSNKEVSSNTLNQSKNNVQNETSDPSIIEVLNEQLDINIDEESFLTEDQLHPPYWSKTYVYSFEEIQTASKEQRRFYNHLKEEVLAGNHVDIWGYTNYAFILYFDFLEEYKKHNDIKLLEEQFKRVGEMCDKTKPYTLQILKQVLSQRSDPYSIGQLENMNDPVFLYENGYSNYSYEAYKLGNKYKKKLGLSRQEAIWLNKIWHPDNNFLQIEGCLFEVMLHYCRILKSLQHQRDNKKVSTEINEVVKEHLIRKQDHYNSFEEDVYLTIFKKIENSVRSAYGHTRKISDELMLKYSKRVQKNFEQFLGEDIDKLIAQKQNEITPPDTATQIQLNTKNVNRWKKEFYLLKTETSGGLLANFHSGIKRLEEVNQKNPNITHIFFEASKCSATSDKVESLKYYAKYVSYSLKSKKTDRKELPKSVQKILFKTIEKTQSFEQIIDNLLKDQDLKKTLEEIDQIYVSKRKRIKLNKSQIKATEDNHEGTVALLNNYLNDDEEKIASELNRIDNATEDITSVKEAITDLDISPSPIEKIQEKLLTIFAGSSFEISQDQVTKFARDNGMLKNQLIDSVNERFEELLDGEVLIEEEGDNYIIEESYYNEIVK